MDQKTNVLRILDSLKTSYSAYQYETDQARSGVEVAEILGLDPRRVYKTLVTVGKSKQHYVFVIPVAMELNLKKAALAAGEKSIEMIKAKELLPLTGYVHGGCSPIGMKKLFPTFVDASALSLETMIFSAGKIGYQVEMTLNSLRGAVPIQTADLT